MGGCRRTKGVCPRCASASAATKNRFFCGAYAKGGFFIKKLNIKRLALTALLIAMEIILTRFLSVQTPIVRISFGFLPIAVIAIMYGPMYAGAGAASADLIGAVLFPSGAFFPGYTVTAFLTGAIYGVFLHNRPKKLVSICAAVLIVTVGLQLGLNTLWLHILTGKGYLALLPARIVKTLLMIPVQVLCIRAAASGRFNLSGGSTHGRVAE